MSRRKDHPPSTLDALIKRTKTMPQFQTLLSENTDLKSSSKKRGRRPKPETPREIMRAAACMFLKLGKIETALRVFPGLPVNEAKERYRLLCKSHFEAIKSESERLSL